MSFFIGNVLLLVLNLPLAPVFAQMLRIPYGYLYPIILLTSLIGAYSVSNNMFSVWLVFVFGLIGYLMKEVDLPMAPFVLGLVLGPLLEKALVQTSAIGKGNLGVMFESPIAVGVIALAIAAIVVPRVLAALRGARRDARV